MFTDFRAPARVEHDLETLVAQRVYGLALGDGATAAGHRYKRNVAMVLLISYVIPMTSEVSGSRYSDGPHREGTMPSRFAIWIAVPVLCAMTWAAAPANECGRLCDLNWMSKASVAEVKAEIDAGADPLAPGKQGRTPLHLATLANPDPSVAVLLIERGANLESRSRFSAGGSPLHLAAGGFGISLRPYASVEFYAMARHIILNPAVARGLDSPKPL